jgi:hypothetical protein
MGSSARVFAVLVTGDVGDITPGAMQLVIKDGFEYAARNASTGYYELRDLSVSVAEAHDE